MGNEPCRCCDKADADMGPSAGRPITPQTAEETISELKPLPPSHKSIEPGRRLKDLGTDNQLGLEVDPTQASEKAGEEPGPAVRPTEFGESEVSTFSFELEPKANLGMKCQKSVAPPGSLIVTTVCDEPDMVAVDGKTLQKGDVITEINGAHGDSEALYNQLMTIHQKGGRLDLKVISRPRVFDVRLTKRQDSTMMGMVVAVHDEVPDRVEVRSISAPGAMTDWNSQNFMKQVHAHDWIIAVHGQNKNSSDMVNDMQNAWRDGAVSFTVSTEVLEEGPAP